MALLCFGFFNPDDLVEYSGFSLLLEDGSGVLKLEDGLGVLIFN